jgi:DNA-binding HxlR family transcriptional regulator
VARATAAKLKPVLGELAVEVNREAQALEGLIHEKMRLGIVSALAATGSMTFHELKELLQTTDGNLSVHARKLEEAGYIECRKTFENRKPKSDYTLTGAGRAALERYLSHLEALLGAMRKR